MDLRVEDSTVDHAFAVWDRILLTIWRGKTTVRAVQKGEQIFEELASRHGERGILLMTIVEPAAMLPPIEARLELVGFLKRGSGKIERSTMVFEGEGFRAASVRAVVAGMSLFSRPAYPHRLFSTVGAAARFLAGGKSGSPPPYMVIRMANETRGRPGSSTFVPWLPGTAPVRAPLRPR